MNPAFSIILFTTLAGAAQGLVVVLGAASLLAADMSAKFVAETLTVAVALLIVALVTSFFHLGHPKRAWRAALMWRTSWMSREVIVMPAFIGVVGLWAVAVATRGMEDHLVRVLPWVAIVGAALLWYCTAMIYACLRFIQEWAHPLTIINYTVIGLSSGIVLAGALGALEGQDVFVASLGGWAVAATLLAWTTRAISLRRNARLKPKSTLRSATGITTEGLVQKSMGMTGGSFNTREFFHHASAAAFRCAKIGFQIFGFGVPIALIVYASITSSNGAWLMALPLQFLGLLAERWFFFAQARHPQNLYYQVVS